MTKMGELVKPEGGRKFSFLDRFSRALARAMTKAVNGWWSRMVVEEWARRMNE